MSATRNQLSLMPAAHKTPGGASKSNSGNQPLARLTGSAMFSAQAWEAIARSLNLSGRELQIVRGLFDDRLESDIAATLGISSHTVHSHLGRLHQKLGVATRTQLALRVTDAFLALTCSPESGLPPLCGKATAGDCPLGR